MLATGLCTYIKILLLALKVDNSVRMVSVSYALVYRVADKSVNGQTRHHFQPLRPLF